VFTKGVSKLKVPALDLKKQIAPIRREIDSAIRGVIDNNSFVFGKEVTELEKRVARFTGVKFAIGVSNGSDAIKLSLIALGIKRGDRVLCPTFTFFATAGAVAAIGAIPVFVDINPLTYNISVPDAVSILKENKGRIKAIIPVDLYGQCADLQEVSRVSRRFGLKIVEDAAQAFGARSNGLYAGTMGDCGTLSFFPGKNLGAFGDAGMVLTNKKPIYQNLLLLRNHGNKLGYRHRLIGYNHRLDCIQAAVLGVKLKYIDRWNRKRQLIARGYNSGLYGLGLHTPFVSEGNTHIYHQYVVGLNTTNSRIVGYLRSKGIDARVYYPLPLHLQPCFRYLGYRRGDFPAAEKSAKSIFTLPIYPDLTKSQLDYTISTIRKYING